MQYAYLERTSSNDRLHPESYRELRALVKLHGGVLIRKALNEIIAELPPPPPLQIDLQINFQHWWRNHGVDYGSEDVAIRDQQIMEYEDGIVCRLRRHPKTRS